MYAQIRVDGFNLFEYLCLSYFCINLGWLTISDPTKAISQCVIHFLPIHEMECPLLRSMDIRTTPAK